MGLGFYSCCLFSLLLLLSLLPDYLRMLVLLLMLAMLRPGIPCSRFCFLGPIVAVFWHRLGDKAARSSRGNFFSKQTQGGYTSTDILWEESLPVRLRLQSGGQCFHLG